MLEEFIMYKLNFKTYTITVFSDRPLVFSTFIHCFPKEERMVVQNKGQSSWFMSSAICRALYKQLVSKKKST